MYIELDKDEFYLKQAKNNLIQEKKNLHKNSRKSPYLFSVSRAYKVKWDESAMDPPREKTSTSHLKSFNGIRKERVVHLALQP